MPPYSTRRLNRGVPASAPQKGSLRLMPMLAGSGAGDAMLPRGAACIVCDRRRSCKLWSVRGVADFSGPAQNVWGYPILHLQAAVLKQKQRAVVEVRKALSRSYAGNTSHHS